MPIRAAYEQYYSARSVWMPAAFAGSGELVIGHELAPDKRQFEHSEFYNDWLRPQGVYDAIGGAVSFSRKGRSRRFGKALDAIFWGRC